MNWTKYRYVEGSRAKQAVTKSLDFFEKMPVLGGFSGTGKSLARIVFKNVDKYGKQAVKKAAMADLLSDTNDLRELFAWLHHFAINAETSTSDAEWEARACKAGVLQKKSSLYDLLPSPADNVQTDEPLFDLGQFPWLMRGFHSAMSARIHAEKSKEIVYRMLKALCGVHEALQADIERLKKLEERYKRLYDGLHAHQIGMDADKYGSLGIRR